MFSIAFILLVLALIAYLLGEERVGGVAIQGAKIFALIGVVLLLLGFAFGGVVWPVGFPLR